MKRNYSVSWKDSSSDDKLKPKLPKTESLNTKNESKNAKCKHKSKRQIYSTDLTVNKSTTEELLENVKTEAPVKGIFHREPSKLIKDLIGTPIDTQPKQEAVLMAEGSSENEFFSENFSDVSSAISFKIDTVEIFDAHVVIKNSKYTCIVKNEWMEISFYKGMRVNIFSCLCCEKKDSMGDYLVVDGENNFLIIEDYIWSVTAVCNSFRCIYKPIIDNKIMDVNFQFSNSALVVGVIIHAVIERCLKEQNYNLKFVVDGIKTAIKNNTQLLYCCNIDERVAMNECIKYVKEILKLGTANFKAQFTEKKIVSQQLGVKGNIDAILSGSKFKVPFEIKTGRKIDISHRAQIILYLLMLKERMLELIDYGYLYYAMDGNLIKIKFLHDEVKMILIQKNKMAVFNFMAVNKIPSDQNFLTYYGKFEPQCKCMEVECCKIIGNLHKIEGPKGDFLREQWYAINEEELAKQTASIIPVKFKSQKDDILCLKYQSESIKKLSTYVDIYSANRNKLCIALVESIENDILQVKLSEAINLHSFYELYISENNNQLFFKFMRFSLLKIAINSDLIDDIKRIQKDEIALTSTAAQIEEILKGDLHKDTQTDILGNKIDSQKGKINAQKLLDKIKKQRDDLNISNTEIKNSSKSKFSSVSIGTSFSKLSTKDLSKLKSDSYKDDIQSTVSQSENYSSNFEKKTMLMIFAKILLVILNKTNTQDQRAVVLSNH
ncbi:hypothetical protein EDEG_01259 [Edhazardia aedis USNM 41457]|uniref:DNA replication factor Dna2 N-terminal domain-containing protein n=1 Tax=Edhazardia aedis (strain USNM 41457) TaxID=1003232 RepID=J8ZXW8_EDHAE|nr:hypothetical protein EDEG_01259 [Edhazardia aedis USNM 41457]|eukprot:EJW04518.1 hypothetical protein EDEG_01259 [Edhazardia aedis USNM 41457]